MKASARAVVRGMALAATMASVAQAQGTRVDYLRAEQFMSANAVALVNHHVIRPNWLPNDRFWYRDLLANGSQFMLMDPTANVQRPLFDHRKLAAALSAAADTTYEPFLLPFKHFELEPDDRAIQFALDHTRGWRCDIVVYQCARLDSAALFRMLQADEVRSPDGRWAAFARDHNLWVRSLETGEVIQLTTDGEDRHAYGLIPGWVDQVSVKREGIVKPPMLAWSPDARRIATIRVDSRGVADLHLIETAEPRPILHSYPYALVGDPVVPTFDIYVIDLATRRPLRVQHPPQMATFAAMVHDSIWPAVHWDSDSKRLFFTYEHRGSQQIDLLVADSKTGTVRTLIEERNGTFVEVNVLHGTPPDWQPLSRSGEIIWYSERDGWGHLYLYDATGALKHRVTEGEWPVADLLRVDEVNRLVYFAAYGREPGRDPYFRHVYRASLDGGGVELLTPEDGDHDVGFSPSGRFFVDTYGRRDTIPVTVLRGADGRLIRKLAEGDVSRLVSAGWSWPERITVKARDGVTDLHGLLFRPSNFDSTRTYPIIVHAAPQGGSGGTRGFSVGGWVNEQSLAELGFFVMAIDALGNPRRSKAFHDALYGDMGDNGIPDNVAAIQQLAQRYSQIDLDRVGIFGHSRSGNAAVTAMLRYPEFFKVGVSSAANHDQRGFIWYWGEKYHGLLKNDADGSDNYESQANQRLAANLEGKLLMVYATLDDNPHPNMTLLLIDELIKHNKNFDVLVLPNRKHLFKGLYGTDTDLYFIRRTWDYFVQHLLGVEPPEGVELKQSPPR